MAKVRTIDGVGAGKKRVLPVEWQEAIPFALKLEERLRLTPAMPERIRYVGLDVGLPDPRDPAKLDRPGINGQNSRTNGDNDSTLLPVIIPDVGDDD